MLATLGLGTRDGFGVLGGEAKAGCGAPRAVARRSMGPLALVAKLFDLAPLARGPSDTPRAKPTCPGALLFHIQDVPDPRRTRRGSLSPRPRPTLPAPPVDHGSVCVLGLADADADLRTTVLVVAPIQDQAQRLSFGQRGATDSPEDPLGTQGQGDHAALLPSLSHCQKRLI
jgi:hypothetical protein